MRVSVVVPVWNTHAYLALCLKSLLGQSLADIEVICVDDGSQDDALTVLHAYEQADPRMRVIALRRNQGVSTARNIGLLAATGEYIAFVDSDDCPEPDFCAKLYAAAVAADADIAKGNHVYRQGEVNAAVNNSIRQNKSNFYIQLGSAIYRTAFLKQHGIVFPTRLSASEDLVFAFSAATLANRVALVDDARIAITMRPGSASFAAPSRKTVISHYRALAAIVQIAIARSVDPASFNFVAASLFALIFRISMRNRMQATRRFAAAKMMQIFSRVQASGQFDPSLFKNALDGRDAMLYACLEEKSMERLFAAAAAMEAERCAVLRSRIR